MANIGALAQQLKDRFEIPIGIREFDCRDRFASGLADIDRLLQGGFPRATLSEITGSASSNRTALTVSTLARAFETGECGAWIDGSGTFDPESAAEAGLKDYDVRTWAGLLAPKGTPPEIIARLNKAVQICLADPAIRERLETAVGGEARGSTPGEMHDLVAAEVAKWRSLIEAAKIPKI